MKKIYQTHGVCSKEIHIDLDENGFINEISFIGGCNGNAKGIAALVEGMHKDEVIDRLKHITCGFRNTSCPAQLTEALKEMDI